MHSAVAHHPLANAKPDSEQRSRRPAKSPQFIWWAWCCTVWNILWASLGQLSWLCSLPAPCAPSHLVNHGTLKKALT